MSGLFDHQRFRPARHGGSSGWWPLANLEQHDRVVGFRATRRARRLLLCGRGARAGFAVIAGAPFAIIALVTMEGFSQFSESLKQRHEKLPALGQHVFDVRRAAAEVAL